VWIGAAAGAGVGFLVGFVAGLAKAGSGWSHEPVTSPSCPQTGGDHGTRGGQLRQASCARGQLSIHSPGAV
jgi:hypothetical protein